MIQSDLANKYGIPYFVFLDSDKSTAEELKQSARKNDLESEGIIICLTRKREIENYIHPSLLPKGIVLNDLDDAKNPRIHV